MPNASDRYKKIGILIFLTLAIPFILYAVFQATRPKPGAQIAPTCTASFLVPPRAECIASFLVLPATSPSATPRPSASPTPRPTATPTATPRPSPSTTPTPLPSPTPGAQCVLIKYYRVLNDDPTIASNWQLLTSGDLARLQPGDVVYFTVLGGVINGATIDGARIRFTSNPFTLSDDVSNNLVPSGVGSVQEYYLRFQIPSGTTTFQIGAEVYSQSLDTTPSSPWNDNSGWR